MPGPNRPEVVRELPSTASSTILDFTVTTAPPYTTLIPYVFDVNYAALTVPETFTLYTEGRNQTVVTTRAGLPGDPLITNSAGGVNGKIYLPNSVTAGYSSDKITIQFYARTRYPGPGGGGEETTLITTLTVPFNHPATTQTSTTNRPSENLVDASIGTSSLPGMNDRSVIGGSSSLTPLAQTFYVDATRYPNGIFATSIDLYFASKSLQSAISIELRNVTNGVPSATDYIAGTLSTVTATNVVIPTSLTSGLIDPTNFKFTRPVHLSPGEYAICIFSISKSYSLFYAKLGEFIIGTNTKLSKETYTGKLFKSQNTNIWLEENNTDLCFRVNKAVFQTGRKEFEIQTASFPEDKYHNLYLSAAGYTFGYNTFLDYSFSGVDTTGAVQPYREIKENTGIKTAIPLRAKNIGDIKFKVGMTSYSKDISPILDMTSTSMYTFKNSIDPYETDTSDSELDSNDGVARSKYISKVVTLAPGFDSTGLEVKVAINRQIGTDIDVYCRVMSAYDVGISSKMENRPWRKMPLFNQTANASTTSSLTGQKSYAGADENSYSIETYKILDGDSIAKTGTNNLSYTAVVDNGLGQAQQTTFTDFNRYQIKVVMYASDTNTYIPKLNGIVATSVL